jgi:hypothetical protein
VQGNLSSDGGNFPSDPAVAEVEAALTLGRLDGALEHAPPPVLRIFAGKVLRDTLVAALRQEGHVFTEQRFHAWFAGLATLSDTLARQARSPRVLCDAILGELAHGSWPDLAALAIQLRPALLAPLDLEARDAHTQVLDVIAEARALAEGQVDAPSHCPFEALASLYAAAAASVTFAPTDRHTMPIAMGRRNLTIDRPSPPSPRWAVDLLYGERLRKMGTLSRAIPLPGLLRLDALRAGNAGEARAMRAGGMRDAARGMVERLRDAVSLSQLTSQMVPHRRSTSRAPALCELLLGFGPLRSAQIESMLGATRLGVRSMIATLEQEGAIARTTISGSHLYSIRTGGERALPQFDADPAQEPHPPFSSEALEDFEASLARIDRLLGSPASSEN